MKCGHFILVGVFAIVAPICVNVLCLVSAFPCMAVTDSNPWIGFFGSYLGGTMTSLVTMYVLFQTIENEKRRKKVEEQKELIARLCNDFGCLCTALDYDKVAFVLTRYYGDKETLFKELSAIELNVKRAHSVFFLKYGHIQSNYKNMLDEKYRKYVEPIRVMVDALSNYTDTLSSENVMTSATKKMEEYGDIHSELLSIAEKWKEEEYMILKSYEVKYRDNL